MGLQRALALIAGAASGASSSAWRGYRGSGRSEARPELRFARALVVVLLFGPGARARAVDWQLAGPRILYRSAYRLEDQRRSNPLGASAQRTLTRTQDLSISTRGWYFHPALVIFSATLNPRLSSEQTTISGGSSSDRGLSGVDFSVASTWLQYKPYTLHLSAQRNTALISNSLTADTLNTNSSYLGQLELKYQPVPTTFTVRHTDANQSGGFGDTTSSNAATALSRLSTARTDTRLKLEYATESRQLRDVPQSSGELNTEIENTLKLWKPLTIHSLASFLDRNTDTSGHRREARARTRVAWRHRDNLDSRYELSFNSRSERRLHSTRLFADAGLTHTLYENLTTDYDLSAGLDRRDGGSLNHYLSALNLSYTRPIKWGRVRANLNQRLRLESNRSDHGSIRVLDETHTLVGVQPARLANDHVESASIVVTDAAGLTTYLLGIDYVLIEVGQAVEIARTLAGAIGDGETVLLDYRYSSATQADRTINSGGLGFGVALFSSLDLDYRLSFANETISSGTSPTPPRKDIVQSLNARYQWRWTDTRLNYELRNTTDSPGSRWSANEALTFRPRRNMSLRVSGEYSQLNLTATNQSSRTFSALATYRWAIRRWFIGKRARLSVDALFRATQGDLQDTSRAELRSTFLWRLGSWRPKIELKWGNERNRTTTENRTRYSIFFSAERHFDLRGFRHHEQ